MYYPMFYFDPTYIFVLVGLIICLAASAKMRSTFSKYSRVRNHWGMTGREADALARDSLASRGLDKFFTHSLGHGIGINIHEFPTLGPNSQDRLNDGMVFSIEPGVYFEGKFGIRIEDSVTLSGGRVVSFMHSDKKLTVL